MLELIVYPKGGNNRLINPSPFCSKSEIFLKLAKVDFKMHEFTGNPAKFPKKKLPVIKDSGNIIADSSSIQKYIEEKFQVDLDAHLSAKEKAQGFAFSKMLEEYFYWSLLHERWFVDENWKKLKQDYFGHMPALVRSFVTGMIRKATLKSAIGHGMSRHEDEEVLGRGKECLVALADFLEDKDFLLGDKVSSFDSVSYAFVASVLHSRLGPELKVEVKKHANLVEYDERMSQLVGVC